MKKKKNPGKMILWCLKGVNFNYLENVIFLAQPIADNVNK